MKKTCKRSLALVLSLLMLLSVAPLSFAAVTCEECGNTVTPITITEPKTATCSEYGYSTAGSYCPNCGNCFTDNEGRRLDKTAHTLSFVPATFTSCEDGGTRAHYVCSVCHNLFLDEDGQQKVTEAALQVTGHTASGETSRHTIENGTKVVYDCTKGGFKYKICAVCGAEYDAEKLPARYSHEHFTVPQVDAKCTEDGMTSYYRCLNCDVPYVGTAPEVIPAGHKLVKEDAVVADCTKTGHPDYWECSACKKVFVLPDGFEVPADATDEEKDAAIKAALEEVVPEYTEDGKTVVKTAIEKITVPVQPHTLTLKTKRDDITCEKDGYLATYTCSVCKKAYIEYDVAKGDKIPNDAFLNVDGLPTYEKDKSGSVYYKFMSKLEDAKVAKRDHIWVQDIGPNSLGYVAPKCNAKGSCLATCAICHKQTTLVLDELDHTPKDKDVLHERTCTRGAYTSNTCSVCGQYYETDLYNPKDDTTNAYAPLGHTYSKDRTKIKDSTCTEKGYYGYACVYCGEADPNNIEYINQLAPHTFGEKVNEVAATCTAEGMKAHYRCTVCNKYFDTAKKEVTKESLVIPKLNHVDKNKDAYCDNCGVIMNGCDHICHKQDVFSKLVWFIARLWYQYLGINQTCKCGLPHYEKAKNPLN